MTTELENAPIHDALGGRVEDGDTNAMNKDDEKLGLQYYDEGDIDLAQPTFQLNTSEEAEQLRGT